MKTVFQTAYEKYGLQAITVTIQAYANGDHLITKSTVIPTHPHNNREKTFTFHLSIDGVPRWITNNQIPFADSIKEYFIDQVPGFDKLATDKARDEETSTFLAEYRKRMENYVPSGEEMSEMRAAFGTGTTVVNVITGKETRL